MNIRCLFGHKWNGCMCIRCNELRDKSHMVVREKCVDTCSVCNKQLGVFHQFENVSDCLCKCKICGELKKNHVWKNYACEKCGELLTVRQVFPVDQQMFIIQLAQKLSMTSSNAQKKILYNAVAKGMNDMNQIIEASFLKTIEDVLLSGIDDIFPLRSKDPHFYKSQKLLIEHVLERVGEVRMQNRIT